MKRYWVLLLVVGLCIAGWLIMMVVETVLDITGRKMISKSKQIEEIDKGATLRMPEIWNLQGFF